MPKHIIHSQYEGREVTVLDQAGPFAGQERKETLVEPFLHVGWTKDGEHLEVATREGGDFDGDHNRPGLFVQLDRSGANELIRTLRRARDAAFGSDA